MNLKKDYARHRLSNVMLLCAEPQSQPASRDLEEVQSKKSIQSVEVLSRQSGKHPIRVEGEIGQQRQWRSQKGDLLKGDLLVAPQALMLCCEQTIHATHVEHSSMRESRGCSNRIS